MRNPGHGGDRLGFAVGTILLTVLALSLGDAVIKGQTAQVGLWQLFLLRSAVALPVFLLLIAMFARDCRLVPKSAGWVAVRVGLLVGMWVAYYASLPFLQLSVAAAAYYTLPMFITLFSAVLGNEKVGGKVWMAVALGFGGVAIILRPSPDGINVYVLLPLLAAMLYTLAMILTRTKCRAEHPLVLALWLNNGFILTGAAGVFYVAGTGGAGSGFLGEPWKHVDAEGWFLIAALALALVIGSVGAAIAYQNGPPSVIGVFDFAYVGFAVLWGVVLFQEVPELFAFAGIAAIVTAGLVVVRAGRV